MGRLTPPSRRRPLRSLVCAGPDPDAELARLLVREASRGRGGGPAQPAAGDSHPSSVRARDPHRHTGQTVLRAAADGPGWPPIPDVQAAYDGAERGGAEGEVPPPERAELAGLQDHG